ncbi:MAG: Beta-barrel assembly-enhancing protease [Phycisphaerae bacterium]|nr:Beta-barrel assembly-enhancing protease [Phycisphaerae bacterium]
MPTTTPNPLTRNLSPLLIVLAVLGVYANSLGNGFTYDDQSIILHNPVISPEQPWWRAWVEPYWPREGHGQIVDVLYRPLTVQLFAWQLRLFGQNHLPFHLLNTLLMAGLSLGVWWLVRRVGAGGWAALGATLWFAVHPIHTEVVANGVGLAELLSAGGVLGTIWSYDHWLRQQLLPAQSAWRWGLVTLGFCFVAIFSKEGGAAVIPMIALWHWWTVPVACADERRARWRRMFLNLIPLLIIFLLYLAARYYVCGQQLVLQEDRVGPGNPLRGAAALQRWLTPLALLGRYLVMLIWPSRLLCDYSANVLLPIHSPLEIFFILGSTALFLAAWVIKRSWNQSGTRLLLLLFFIFSYLLASQVFVLLEAIFAERRIFLASIWIAALLGLCMQCCTQKFYSQNNEPRASARAKQLQPLIFVLTVLWIIGLSWKTTQRNPAWRNNETLFRTDLAAMSSGSRSAHLLYMVADLERRANRYNSAAELLNEALAIIPNHPDYWARLGEIHLEAQDWPAAMTALERAATLAPHHTQVRQWLLQARAHQAGIDPLAALVTARRYALQHPTDATALQKWAGLAEQTDLAEAEQAYTLASRQFPDQPWAWSGLAYTLAARQKTSAAIHCYEQMLVRWPEDWETLTNLSVLLMDPDQAEFDAPRAVALASQAVKLASDNHADPDTLLRLQLNQAEALGRNGQYAVAAILLEKLTQELPKDDPRRAAILQRADYFRQNQRD